MVIKHGLEPTIVGFTSFLSETPSMRQRLVAILNGLHQQPRCEHPDCNNPVSFIENGIKRNQYHEYCSLKCSNNSPKVKQKKEQTTRNNYGVDNPSKSDVVKIKKVQTSLDRFGVEYPWQSDVVKNIKHKSMMAEYGVSNIMMVDESKKKNLESKLQSVWYYNVTKTPHYHLLRDPIWLKNQHHNEKKTAVHIASELKISPTLVLNWLHHHNIEVKYFFSSYQEQELCKYVQEQLGVRLEINSRNLIPPYELDMVCHERKIAIEYNGLYWHSEGATNSRIKPSYHVSKTDACESIGYRLIHVFENEWMMKRDIVKSRLRHQFNVRPERVLYARNLQVSVLEYTQVKEFLNKNHIQGSCPSSINLGLVVDGNVIAAMTFGKSRYCKQSQYELLRFAIQSNHNVVGACGKMFKYFIKHYNPMSIISYADRRWSNGNVYKTIGMNFIHNSTPNYFYINPSNPMILESRVKYQKHKLHRMLEFYDPQKSEVDNMFLNGFRRIWDCGNMKFEWVSSTQRTVIMG